MTWVTLNIGLDPGARMVAEKRAAGMALLDFSQRLAEVLERVNSCPLDARSVRFVPGVPGLCEPHIVVRGFSPHDRRLRMLVAWANGLCYASDQECVAYALGREYSHGGFMGPHSAAWEPWSIDKFTTWEQACPK